MAFYLLAYRQGICECRDIAEKNFFTDGSKFRGIVGGVFCKEISVKLRFRLPDLCNVFFMQKLPIKATEDVLLRSAASFTEVSIHSDSRAAILSLSSHLCAQI